MSWEEIILPRYLKVATGSIGAFVAVKVISLDVWTFSHLFPLVVSASVVVLVHVEGGAGRLKATKVTSWVGFYTFSNAVDDIVRVSVGKMVGSHGEPRGDMARAVWYWARLWGADLNFGEINLVRLRVVGGEEVLGKFVGAG